MTMLHTYGTLAWWLLPIALVVWWARRRLFTPWARFVSYCRLPPEKKPGGQRHWFVTVKRVHWYPPFGDYLETYRSFAKTGGRYWWAGDSYCWAEEVTGHQVSDGRDAQLTAMCMIADSRADELDEMLRDVKPKAAI